MNILMAQNIALQYIVVADIAINDGRNTILADIFSYLRGHDVFYIVIFALCTCAHGADRE
jgi:hypothetical protein